MILLFASLLALPAPEPIVLDTDPGTFTDDNVAIVMCVRSPERLRILAVTTVSGNVWSADGVRNARATLRTLGRKIPVYLGAQDPPVHNAERAKQQGPLEFAGAFDTPKPAAARETAGGYLVRLLESHPGGITILAIGPLTNIARLIRERPDLTPRIRRLVIMGGNIHVPGNATRAAEFNFWFDPEAARIVMQSGIEDKVLFGLDICNRAPVSREVFDSIVSHDTPVTRLYRQSFGYDFPAFYKKPEARGYLWDELAAAYLIDPGVVTKSETRFLDVITEFGPRYGATIESGKPVPGAKPVRVMLDLDLNRALTLYRKLLVQ